MNSKISEILTQPWQQQLRSAIRRSDDLIKLLDIDPLNPSLNQIYKTHFPLMTTHSYINRMQAGNPRDPLLLQILPSNEEGHGGGLDDAVGDAQATIKPGLLHKYSSRVLLLATSACAVHCRYCFRRNFPYEDIPHNKAEWSATLNQVRKDPRIDEVILSGGDPLALSDERLFTIIDEVSSITHVKTLRIHTRIPIVLPARVTNTLTTKLSSCKKNLVVVVHANHANEIKYDCEDALLALKNSGATLLNQSVLLRGINDTAETLRDLSRELFKFGVLPYYLHRLDKVNGGMHFEVPEDEGIALIRELSATLPGYLVPRFVREDQGMPSKTLII